MGSDLQCSRIAFLAVVNVFDVLIFSGALFHTLASSKSYDFKLHVIESISQLISISFVLSFDILGKWSKLCKVFIIFLF